MAAAIDDNIDEDFATPFKGTPIRKGHVPTGHLLVADKWKGTKLASLLQKQTSVTFSNTLGIIDFHPSTDTAVIYITEADIVSEKCYRRKLIQMRRANHSLRGIVLVEKTSFSKQYFPSLQKFVVLELGLIIIPLSSPEETAQLLSQMVLAETKAHKNPFKLASKKTTGNKTDVLNALHQIPGLGEVKAKILLQHYKSLLSICNSPVDELAKVIGRTSAEKVYQFFNLPPDKWKK